MFYLFLLFTLPLAASFPSFSSGCMKVYNGGQTGSLQQVVRIFNGCGDRMMVNACVQTNDGKVKLYQSGRTVPVAGNYTLYPFDDPVRIDIAFAPFNPAIPPMCVKNPPNKKS